MEFPKETFTAKWTEPLTNLFVNVLVEEVKKGNRTSSTYNKAGWKNIRTEFNKRARLQYSQVQLKNKVNKLKQQYRSFKKLLSQYGFSWDAENKVVIVHDPSIWELHIKDNSEWAKFKKDGFPQYNELCIVFGDTYAFKKYVQENDEDLIVSEEDDDGGGHAHDDYDGNAHGDADGDPEHLGEHIDEGAFTHDKSTTQTQDNHRLDRTPNTKRRRNSEAFDIANTCKALQEMIKSKASPSMSASITSQAPPQPRDPYSISAMIDILVSMPELEQDLYNKAVERGCISATWREAFIESPTQRRKGLIQYL